MNIPFIFGKKKEGVEEPTLTQEQLQQMEKDVQQYIMPPEKTEELKDLLKTSVIFPRPNDDAEFIVPLFNARKHYIHLKRMIWKHYRR